MVAEVRIYAEGGGNRDDTKTLLRQGFREFFRDLEAIARERNIGWRIVACGSREGAYRAFKIALKANPTAFNVLLVDAEEAVEQTPWLHLAQRDGWACPEGVTDDQCHLMVQCMEAWFIADRDTLRQYYGQGFLQNTLPRTRNIETVAKVDLSRRLEQATRQTQKGEYHKIRHGTELLARVSTSLVRASCPHCDRLFITLHRVMTEEA
jgi:hypothetical protein